ncbi:MAG: serine/threonine protein kinase [Spirulina sp. SIO3F2]|nr:serine/threonine protein kinase [Spirulina sp. SIO3F2]
MSQPDLHQQGETIRDRYQIDSVLGQGAIGTTYGAIDLQTGETIALKVLSIAQMQDWKVLELFEREAQTLANLAHPCIPRYLDHFHVGTERDRRFYLVQQYIAGRSLETLIRQGPAIAEAEVRAIALQTLDILDYLHSREPAVIHRDIKPQNLIYTPERRIILVDFGAVQEAFRHTLSRGGTFVGTVDYMPPEQFRGQATFASDLYSLGVTLIDLLTGPTLISDIPEKRLKLDFRSVVEVSPDFATWLDRLIEPAIEDRFQSTQTARQALQAHNPTTTTELTRPTNSRIIFQRNPESLTVYISPAPWQLWSGLIMTFNIGFSSIWGLISVLTLGTLTVNLGQLLWQQTMAIGADGFLAGIILSILIAVIWLIPALLWTITRRLRGDTIELDLRPEGFRLKYRCFPLNRTVIGDLTSLKLQLQSHRQGIKFVHLARTQRLRHSFWGLVWQSSDLFDYRFGQWLTFEEQLWLVQELETFLKSAQAKAEPATTNMNFDAPIPALRLTKSTEQKSRSEHNRLQITKSRDRFELTVSPMLAAKSQAWLLWVTVILSLTIFPLSLVAIGVFAVTQPHMVWSLFGHFALRIDAHQFCLQWRYLNWQRTVKGPTLQLKSVEFRHGKILGHHQPILACALISQRRPYLFGSWLHNHEKDWVMAELQAFLAQLPKANAG